MRGDVCRRSDDATAVDREVDPPRRRILFEPHMRTPRYGQNHTLASADRCTHTHTTHKEQTPALPAQRRKAVPRRRWRRSSPRVWVFLLILPGDRSHQRLRAASPHPPARTGACTHSEHGRHTRTFCHRQLEGTARSGGGRKLLRAVPATGREWGRDGAGGARPRAEQPRCRRAYGKRGAGWNQRRERNRQQCVCRHLRVQWCASTGPSVVDVQLQCCASRQRDCRPVPDTLACSSWLVVRGYVTQKKF